ncbi:MAG: hypothetical protein NT061_03420 [Spirochaetes bacterium]|nr:hypothetical protein [Spirochaetota bacterium]
MSEKKIKLVILFLLVSMVAAPSFGQSIWTVQEMAEIDGFSELDDILVLKFKDAISGVPIQAVTVNVDGGSYIGDSQGVVRLPIELVEDVDDRDLPFTASVPGYITLQDTLRIRLGSVISKRFVMTKGLQFNQARFVLEWEKKPADLDAHLEGPGFHISYRNMRSSPGNAALDRDARQGYGPETITLSGIRNDATYTFSIENYSREAPMSNVKITVYFDNAMHKTLFFPEIRQNTLAILTIRNGGIIYGAR